MTMTRLGLVALALALLAGASCTMNPVKYEQGLPPRPGGDPMGLYRIVTGDVLGLEGGKHEELSKDSVRVDEQGNINLAYVGKVAAAGKTKSELEEAINAAYRDSGQYPDSQVSANVLTLFYYVDGQVRNPGKKGYVREITLYRAIVDAGGFTEFAAPTRVLLMRQLPDGENKVWKINVKRVMRGEPDSVVIVPNDVIRVPKSVF